MTSSLQGKCRTAMPLNRIGILTGGGDCSGLNAVIRGITRSAIIQHKAAVLGIEGGFEGLIRDRTRVLTMRDTRDILAEGGTILGTTNKGNPFEYREKNDNGDIVIRDLSERVIKNFRKMMLDCLFVVGGEGTLQIGYELYKRGLPIIGVPKTIDNDLEGTDYTFGFQTAVQVASDALDRLRTTGKSHQRVMILEVMGRDSGWIALEAGIAGGAHIILIPEIPFSMDNVLEKIKLRQAGGSPFSMIVVTEGATELGGGIIAKEEADKRLQGVAQLGGVGQYIAVKVGGKSTSKCGAPPSAISKEAGRPTPSTECWRRALPPTPSKPPPRANSAIWSPSTRPTSPPSR